MHFLHAVSAEQMITLEDDLESSINMKDLEREVLIEDRAD